MAEMEAPVLCEQGCGRPAAAGFTSCCRTCIANQGRHHGPGCNPGHATSGSLCVTPGCQRPKADGFQTCCQTCVVNQGLHHGPTCERAAQKRSSSGIGISFAPNTPDLNVPGHTVAEESQDDLTGSYKPNQPCCTSRCNRPNAEGSPFCCHQCRQSNGCSHDQACEAAHKQRGVIIYTGFTQHAFRLAFHYGQKYSSSGGPWKLSTIHPDGNCENRSIPPGPERMLTAFASPQSLPCEKAAKFQGTPYVWDRNDGTCALVQVWTGNYNAGYIEGFAPQSQNPDDSRFDPQAVQEFESCLSRIFGRDVVQEVGIKYCHKKTCNYGERVYVGNGRDLMRFLHKHPDIVASMKILALDSNDEGRSEGSILCQVDRQSGAQVPPKRYQMSNDEQYALFMRKGYDTSACVEAVVKFREECDFHDCEKVVAYSGFKETTSRLVFHYGQKFGAEGQSWNFSTVLPNGCVQGGQFESGPEGCVFGYPFDQVLEDRAKTKAVAPYVGPSGSLGNRRPVGQIWKTKHNATFAADFNVYITNPNESEFPLSAVDCFRAVLSHVFSAEVVEEVGIKFAKKKRQTVNKRPIYKGKSEDLINHLRANPDIQTDMNILEVGPGQHGTNPLAFRCECVSNDGKTSQKIFTMQAGSTYVLYVRMGYDTMACVKLFEQFEKETEFLPKLKIGNAVVVPCESPIHGTVATLAPTLAPSALAVFNWSQFHDPRGLRAHMCGNDAVKARIWDFDKIMCECDDMLDEKMKDPDTRSKFTDSELLGILLYSSDRNDGQRDGNLYFEENQDLRQGNQQAISACWGVHVYFTLEAMKKLDDHATKVYRGLSDKTLMDGYVVGSEISFGAWTSTASELDNAKEFAKASGGSEPIILIIQVNSGKNISSLSMFNNENEVLLTPNHRFVVSKVPYLDKKMWYMDLKEKS